MKVFIMDNTSDINNIGIIHTQLLSRVHQSDLNFIRKEAI